MGMGMNSYIIIITDWELRERSGDDDYFQLLKSFEEKKKFCAQTCSLRRLPWTWRQNGSEHFSAFLASLLRDGENYTAAAEEERE